jgi:CheY-like chemotaxis protein
MVKMKSRKNILIVEDEHINRELLKIYLEKHFDLTFAENLDTAIHCLDTNMFDLVITDIRLGSRLDGIVLLDHIRQHEQISKTPVVAYTASETSINQKSFAEEGFDGFIPKPVTESVLVPMIETFFVSK